VVPALRAAGHAVYTPTLTGLGERAHLANPAIDLAPTSRIVNLLEAEELARSFYSAQLRGNGRHRGRDRAAPACGA